MKQFLSRCLTRPFRVLVCLVCMMSGIIPSAHAQQIQVSGTVADKQGEPIIGATIWEKGTANNRTITGLDGDFSISLKPGAIISVSYIGYTTKEVEAKTVLHSISFLTKTHRCWKTW